MTDLIEPNRQSIPLPAARLSIAVRAGTVDDLPFIDALQKKHHKQLAFFNRPTLEGKIKLGHVLVAEVASCELRVDSKEGRTLATRNQQLATPAGYLIGNDRYQHRDELGVIFQLAVAPEYRRSLVAAHLLRAQFERSAYGCRLYCCWCAQDIEGNRFWESMGFVPIAYRAGSEKKKRVHIFWQKRIREGDVTTPWWFPSETRGGLMDASRIALPLPPGLTWKDELPILHLVQGWRQQGEEEAPALLESAARPKVTQKKAAHPKTADAKTASPNGLPSPRAPVWFGRPGVISPVEVPSAATIVQGTSEAKPLKPKRIKKAHPELASKARELRDRWLERANSVGLNVAGKYDISRRLPSPDSDLSRVRLLAA